MLRMGHILGAGAGVPHHESSFLSRGLMHVTSVPWVKFLDC